MDSDFFKWALTFEITEQHRQRAEAIGLDPEVIFQDVQVEVEKVLEAAIDEFLDRREAEAAEDAAMEAAEDERRRQEGYLY